MSRFVLLEFLSLLKRDRKILIEKRYGERKEGGGAKGRGG